MFGVFMHKEGSIYDDVPYEKYQFPKQYLDRAKEFEGGWVLYYAPGKAGKKYFAYAKVQKIIADPDKPNMFRAIIEPNSYEGFDQDVPFRVEGELMEKSLLNEKGSTSGRGVWAVRPIPASDFYRILDRGILDDGLLLPREAKTNKNTDDLFENEQIAFDIERQRELVMISRPKRDRRFRRKVLRAYDERCAFTGLKIINGGGRAEVQAAHIRPVETNGPDSVQNGIALSGTVHWMFDRGLLGLEDNMEIKLSRHINDRDSIEKLIHPSGFATKPEDPRHAPHPAFLGWHRDVVFKS